MDKPSESKKAKITFSYIGRLEYRGRMLKQIATLQEAGHECRLVYGDWSERSFRAEDYDFPVEVIPTTRKWGSLALFLRQLRFGWQAGKKIAESDATHVSCFSLESLLAGALAKRRRPSLKLIFDSNELHLDHYVSKIKRWLWTPVQNFCVPKCDVIIHAEGNRLEYFKEHYDPGERTHSLLENFPNYIESDDLVVREERKPVKVLYVGGLGWERYTRELVDIFRELAPDFSLELVGPLEDGPFKDELFASMEENPAPNVTISPAIPYTEMSNLIRRFDVGIALYKNNNINNYFCAPNKVYDYLMSGVPVVGNDYPGLSKVLEGGKVGACIKEVDLENFKVALERIRDERRWENITDEVRRRYSWEAQMPGFLGLYEQ